MPRRREVPKREILPDPKFGDQTLAKFVNILMVDGKKSVAEKIIYGALDLILQRGKEDSLAVFNAKMIGFRENIERVMTAIGTRMGSFVQGQANRIGALFNDFISNLDTIAAKLDAGWSKFQQIQPMLKEASKLFLAMQATKMVLGPMLSAAGALGSGLAAIGGMAGAGAGTAAAGAAGTAGAAAATGGATTAIAALGTAATAIAWPLAALVAGVVGLYAGIKRFSTNLAPMADSVVATFTGIGTDVMEILSMIWDFLEPPLAFLGGLIAGAVLGAFRLLGGIIRVVLVVLKGFARVLKWVGDNILEPVFDMLGRLFIWFMEVLSSLGEAFNNLAEWFNDTTGESSTASGSGVFASGLQEIRDAWNGSGAEQESEGGGAAGGSAPGARGGTTVNMQGSRITVNQEFREADPDRVWVSFRDAMEREAVQRTQSGFANALTR